MKKRKGMRKEDAVLNMLINRPCRHGDIATVFEDLEKYFHDELPKMASFLGMKFGYKVADWDDCKSQISTAAVEVEADSLGNISIAAVLTHLRRSKSEAPPGQHDSLRERTERLVRPRRNKKHK